MTAAPRPDLSGVLVVDKPVGPTSFEVVRRVRRALGAASAGHAGTLDPLASGVLVLCVGRAAKLQAWLTDGDKAYEAQVAFGAATSTQDREGEVTARQDPSRLTAAALAAVLPGFLGAQQQVPPMFSAVRIDGRRLHEAARAGDVVDRPPRAIRIEALDLLDFEGARDGLAHARVSVRCSKGTYIRTLAQDLGAAVGLPAHLAALRRTAAGPFTLADAVALDALEADRALARTRLLPLEAGVRGWAVVRLTPDQARALGQGKRLAGLAPVQGMCAALSQDGRLLALCEGSAGVLRPVRVLAPAG